MEYKVLKKNIFSIGNYGIVPIRVEDRHAIMRWRNEQIYHLRQAKPLTEVDQDNYFANVIAKLFSEDQPNQILFSYLEKGVCIGYGGLVHINWNDRNAEISFIVNTKLEQEYFHKHWGIYLGLIQQVAFEELNLHKIFTFAFDVRPHLYKAIEAVGFEKEAILREHCFFGNRFIDVVIHSKFNSYLSLRSATYSDSRLYFEWANDDDVRLNSFNSDKIEWQDHLLWFKSKIADRQSRLYVLLLNETPVGQIRLDKEGEYWLVDYSIDKMHRGKGMASKMMKMMLEEGLRPIKAIVRKNNLNSLRVFEKVGFSRRSEKVNSEEVYVFYKY